MLFSESQIREREDNFYKELIKLYLKYGSVDTIFKVKKYNLPISYPSLHRLIKRWGIVKSVGPNSKLSETLTILNLMTKHQSIDRLYKSLPLSFQTSLTSLHRIAHNIKEGLITRYGTALVITLNNKNKILVGYDNKNKALTIPMTYSSPKESPKESILRVLQQEVYTDLAVEKKLPKKIIPKKPKPFMHLLIGNIKVSVYQIELAKKYLENFKFSSYKVTNHKFMNIDEITNLKISVRLGVKEIIKYYYDSSFDTTTSTFSVTFAPSLVTIMGS